MLIIAELPLAPIHLLKQNFYEVHVYVYFLVCVYVHLMTVEANLLELPPTMGGPGRWNSACQAWQQVPFPQTHLTSPRMKIFILLF